MRMWWGISWVVRWGVEGVDSLLSENVLEDGRVGWVKVGLFGFW